MRQFGNPTKPLNGTLGYPSIPNPNHQKFRTHRKNSHFPNKSEEPSNSLAKSETFRATSSWFPKNVRTTSEARCVYSLLFSKGSTLQIETEYMEKKHTYIYIYVQFIYTYKLKPFGDMKQHIYKVKPFVDEMVWGSLVGNILPHQAAAAAAVPKPCWLYPRCMSGFFHESMISETSRRSIIMNQCKHQKGSNWWHWLANFTVTLSYLNWK